MVMAKKDLGEILLAKKLISAEDLGQAREVQKSAPGDIGRIIVDLGLADEKAVAMARAESMGIKFVDLNSIRIDHAAVNAVPEHLANKYKIIAIEKQDRRLTVAVADVNNPYALQDVRITTGCQIVPVMASEEDIEDAIKRCYKSIPGGGPVGNVTVGTNNSETAPVPVTPAQAGLSASIKQDIATFGARGDEDAGDDEDVESAKAAAEEAPIIRIVNTVIQQAIRDSASDIHIEPDRRGVRVRYRIDGVLHETMSVPKYIQAPLISRLKIMAEMNIAERRVPQDGRIPIRHDGKDFDLRVSCLPTIHGEKIVMRILDKSSVLIGMNKLGFTAETQAQIEEIVSQPNGMFLSTGPTGSGKTTTQYSVLNKINSVEKNIITVEDPAEYQLAGISQVQVNKKAGLDFGNALRSFLRQDPDIIMVGEMRDLQTAEIAVEAALTGHLVLSTLHTNDAPSAVIRMVDMGIEPFLISATVIGVLAQRLARKICSNCKTSYTVPASDLARFGLADRDPNEQVQLYRGAGCEVCRGTGFKGRVGIYELMRLNSDIADMVVRRTPLSEVKAAAKANGMHELREDGLLKVLEGVTTPDEVMRVVFTAGY